MLLLLLLITSGYSFDAYSYTKTYDVKVGDKIDVYSTPHSNTISVLWTYDSNVVRPVTTIYPTSTYVRFEAVGKSAAPGSIIQATTYFTYSGGSGKTFDDYLVVVKEDEPDNPPVEPNWDPTLTLSSTSVKLGESVTATARVTPSGYKGKYRWKFYGSGAVDPGFSPNPTTGFYITSNNSISLRTVKAGNCYVSIYLENGQCYTKTLKIIEETADDIIRNLRFDSDTQTGECGDIWETRVSFDELVSSTRSAQCSSSNPEVAVVKSMGRVFDSSDLSSGGYRIQIQALSPGETTIRFSYGGVQAKNSLKLTVLPAWSMLESLATDYENIQRSLGNKNCRSNWRISQQVCMEGPEFCNIFLESNNVVIDATPSINLGFFLMMTQEQLLQQNSQYVLHIPKHALQKCDGSLNEQDYEIKFITGIGDETGEGVYMVTSMNDWDLDKPTYFIPETSRTDTHILYEREIMFPLNKTFGFKFIPQKGSWTGGFGNGEPEFDFRLGGLNGFGYHSLAYDSDDADEWKMGCITDESTIRMTLTVRKRLDKDAPWPWVIHFECSKNTGLIEQVEKENCITGRTYYDLLGNRIAIPQKGHFYIVVEGDKREKIIY